ncbi:unnamed protein product [Ceratitis capitata]|uniref:(Mediterranean fruit fly) hypothetical protein n=1 Tax=Ceratitis capitata TaxID=7213 RepID=A0A811U1K3_CERCA|nr:unnamed protein product [Ceratitis capitata]
MTGNLVFLRTLCSSHSLNGVEHNARCFATCTKSHDNYAAAENNELICEILFTSALGHQAHDLPLSAYRRTYHTARKHRENSSSSKNGEQLVV